EFDTVVAAGIAHDNRVVAEHPGEGVHHRRRILVGRIRLPDLDGTPAVGCQPDEAVARGQTTLDDIAEVAVALADPRSGADIDFRFYLIYKLERLIAEVLEATDAQIGQIGGHRRHPAKIADGIITGPPISHHALADPLGRCIE